MQLIEPMHKNEVPEVPILKEDVEIIIETKDLFRVGGYYYLEEGVARERGSTHDYCMCGNIKRKMKPCCVSCEQTFQWARYSEAPKVEWNGEQVYSDAYDQWFNSPSEAIDWVESELDEKVTIKDMRLYQSQPEYLEEPDWTSTDELPDGVESVMELLPQDVREKYDELTALIREKKIVSCYRVSRVGIAERLGDQ